MPILDLSQDCLDICGHRAFAQVGIDNRNAGGRDLVAKIRPRLVLKLIFVVGHLPPKRMPICATWRKSLALRHQDSRQGLVL